MLNLRQSPYVPVFNTGMRAVACAVEAADYFASYVPQFGRENCRAIGKREFGFVPELSFRLKGWGKERGFLCCLDGIPVGVALVLPGQLYRVNFPIKPYVWTLATHTGSRYLGYADGTWFCCTADAGPIGPGNAIYFISQADADDAKPGRCVRIERQPKKGLLPLAFSVAHSISEGQVLLPAEGWRLGSTIMELYFVPH